MSVGKSPSESPFLWNAVHKVGWAGTVELITRFAVDRNESYAVRAADKEAEAAVGRRETEAEGVSLNNLG